MALPNEEHEIGAKLDVKGKVNGNQFGPMYVLTMNKQIIHNKNFMTFQILEDMLTAKTKLRIKHPDYVTSNITREEVQVYVHSRIFK